LITATLLISFVYFLAMRLETFMILQVGYPLFTWSEYQWLKEKAFARNNK